MKKPFGFLLAALFLFVQTATVLHMAEHGFAEHKHHGHTCDISIYYHQGQMDGTASANVAATASAIAIAPPSFATPLLAEEHHYSSVPRAPPTLI